MKVLIIVEYTEAGCGTFSFLLQLLKIHKINNIDTAVLLSKKQKNSSIVAIIRQYTDKIIFSKFDRTRLFFRPVVSLFFDFFYCFQGIYKFKPDIIHISHSSPNLLIGVLLFNVHVAITIHTYPSVLINKFAGLILSRQIFHNKIINTVSKYSALQIEQYLRIKPEFISVIYNSVERVFGDHDYGKNVNVLTLGHVESYKNPEIWLAVAVRVITTIKTVKFYWLGNGLLVNLYREKVKEFNLENNIFFVGYQSDVAIYYKNASIYFHPSRMESHGIAVVEAMAYGLPCVTSDAGGLPESVVNNLSGFICSVDAIAEYVEKIKKLLVDKELRKKMGLTGKDRALEFFGSEKQEKEYMEMYCSILAS